MDDDQAWTTIGARRAMKRRFDALAEKLGMHHNPLLGMLIDLCEAVPPQERAYYLERAQRDFDQDDPKHSQLGHRARLFKGEAEAQ